MKEVALFTGIANPFIDFFIGQPFCDLMISCSAFVVKTNAALVYGNSGNQPTRGAETRLQAQIDY